MSDENTPRITGAIAFAKMLGEALGIKLDRVVRIELVVDSGNVPTLQVTHLITERQVPKGTVVGYEQLPVDGIVELWFDSIESIDRIFGCPAGLALMAHAGSFIGEITTTLVEVHVVVDADPRGAHHGH